MNILFLTQYYPPETGAPQNRLHSLAKHFKELGAEVSVLTALPNYPIGRVFAGYRGRWTMREDLAGVDVHRCFVIPSRSARLSSRLNCYLSFMFTSLMYGVFCLPKHDVILCESPPLFLGITAVVLKVVKRSRLVFNVSDLWPESVEKLGIVKSGWKLRAAYRLEAWIYHHADLISGQTQGIVASIRERFAEKLVYWLPNGIDEDSFHEQPELARGWRESVGWLKDDFVILYAGVIGHAQGLDVILRAAANLRNNSRIKFAIVGDGPEKEHLRELNDELRLTNVMFLDNQPHNTMPQVVGACDAYVVPLKKLDLFRGAIPSKIFEPLALGKPVLLGVEGEAHDLFIVQASAGVAFIPEDANSLTSAIRDVVDDPKACQEMGERGRKFVLARFNRRTLAFDFWIFLNQLLRQTSGQELLEADTDDPSAVADDPSSCR